MPGALLFDYDDTLVQTRRCKYAALSAVATRYYGVELSELEIDRHWGIAYEELFRALFGHVERDVAVAIARYEALDEEFAMQAYPESAEVLNALADRCPIGVVTAAGRRLVERQMRALAFPVDRLSVLQTAEDTPFHKPDPRVFAPALRSLAHLGIAAESVTYIGDSLNDLFAARGAGLAFTGVLRGTTRRAAFEAEGASVIDSLRDLID